MPELPERLDADEFLEAIGGQRAYDRRLELDYELSRLARLNCEAFDADAKPKWVLKGGFAIRHTYQSERLSADVDVAPMPGLRAGGSGELLLPAEVTLKSRTMRDKMERWNLTFKLLLADEPGGIWADLNTGRPIRVPPPQRRPFRSQFMDDFPVWVASIEEIIAEKSNGLLSFSYGDSDRIKDAFDLWFLLTNNHADSLRKKILVSVLGQLYVTKGVRCPTTGLGAWFNTVLQRSDAPIWWGRIVAPQLRGRARISFDRVCEELPELAQRHLV